VSIHVSVHKLIGCEIKFVMNGKWNHPFVDQEHQHFFQHHVPHQYPILPLKNLDQDFVVIPMGLITNQIGKPAFIVSTYRPAKKNASTKMSVLVFLGPRHLVLTGMTAGQTRNHDVWCTMVP